MTWWAITLIGAGVGFVAGPFGAGGSAVGTPLLHLVGVPAFVALASPLPAAAPGHVTHWALGHIDWRVVRMYTVLAVPAAYLGARLVIRANPGWLARGYGVVLILLAAGVLLPAR